MAQSQKSIRQSVSLPSTVAQGVQALAKRSRTSANRVIVDLIESGSKRRSGRKSHSSTSLTG
jgi:hypothetical protein